MHLFNVDFDVCVRYNRIFAYCVRPLAYCAYLLQNPEYCVLKGEGEPSSMRAPYIRHCRTHDLKYYGNYSPFDMSNYYYNG